MLRRSGARAVAASRQPAISAALGSGRNSCCRPWWKPRPSPPQSLKRARKQSVQLRTPPETPPGTNYFVDMVAGDVRRLLGSSSGDLTLRTTLNLSCSGSPRGSLRAGWRRRVQRRMSPQASLVALGKDGAILAMVGGRDYEASQFNRATQAKRQAGSLFKLFVYLTALQRGYTPQSVVVDRPTQIGEWEPQNYSGGFRGMMTLRNAFVHSINTIAAAIGRRSRHPRRHRDRQAHGRAVDAAGGAKPGAGLGRGYVAGDDTGFRRCRRGFSDRTLIRFAPLPAVLNRRFTPKPAGRRVHESAWPPAAR